MSTNATKVNNMICIGSPLPADFIKAIMQVPHLDFADIKWVEEANVFVSFQNFFKIKPETNLQTLKDQIRLNIYYKYFPITMQSKGLTLLPSTFKPRTLEWELEMVCLKDTKNDVTTYKERMTNDMKDILKTAFYGVQTAECNPSIILARTPESVHKFDLNPLREFKMPRERFYLEKLFIATVSKDETGLKYKFDYVE